MKISWRLGLFLSFMILSSCSDDSENIKVTFEPSHPIVRFTSPSIPLGTDAQGTTTYHDVTGPWFLMKLTINNGSKRNVVIDSLSLKLSGQAPDNSLVEATVAVDATNVFITGTGPLPTSYILSVPPGMTSTTEDIYVENLPSTVPSGVYFVEMEAVGWFGDPTTPQQEFRQKYYFTTN